MRRTATRRYKAKMDCLEKEYTFTSHKIKIPRWYGFTATDIGHLELHVFSDASQCAYGAVVYIRYILNKSVICNFVLGKSGLAPNKTEFNEQSEVGITGRSHCSTT